MSARRSRALGQRQQRRSRRSRAAASAGGSPSRHPWSPLDVAAIANGFHWLAGDATGLGTTGFAIPEGGGKNAWNLAQATVDTQPTALSENKQQQLRMRRSVDANPTIIALGANQRAGWTGATYIAGWFRFPSGVSNSTVSTLLAHSTTSAGNVRLAIQLLGATPFLRFQLSTNGSANVLNNFAHPFGDQRFHWLETFFDPALAQAARVYAMSDFEPLAQSLIGSNPTSMFDGTAPIGLGCRAAGGFANIDTTDWATVYYGNGIPSLVERQLLRAYRAPIQL